MQRALNMLGAKHAEGLLVAKLDRLTRSVADMATLIAQYFGDRAPVGAALLSVADQVDTRTAAGRLVLNILASVSQWEREAIAERTRSALAYKKEQGVRLGRPPLGADADDAAMVAAIAEMRQRELTLREMAERLEAEGYKTKKGGRWAPETVRKIIARQMQAGA
jgi:DNA invertase Pin-like site-specific DNA recombinase